MSFAALTVTDVDDPGTSASGAASIPPGVQPEGRITVQVEWEGASTSLFRGVVDSLVSRPDAGEKGAVDDETNEESGPRASYKTFAIGWQGLGAPGRQRRHSAVKMARSSSRCLVFNNSKVCNTNKTSISPSGKTQILLATEKTDQSTKDSGKWHRYVGQGIIQGE